MKNHLFILLASFAFISASAQHKMKRVIMNGDTFYVQEPTRADKLLEKGDLDAAIKEYHKEFRKAPQETAYNFACAFARNNQPDSAFKYLYYDLSVDSFAWGVFSLSDPDFISLRSSPKWIPFRDAEVNNFELHGMVKLNNLQLAAKLWDMQAWDQAYYNEIDIAEKKVGRTSSVVTALWQLKEMINQKNQHELDSIIAINGWPKISDVGHRASGAAFLIIQHSTLELQQKYLPTIKALCEQKEADWESYALMYDRVQVGLGKPQLYGSQLTIDPVTGKITFSPIEDEANVNKRRADLGMEPIEDYAKLFGIKYEPKK